MNRAWIGSRRRVGALIVFVITGPIGLIPFTTLNFFAPDGPERFTLIVLFGSIALRWVVAWQVLYWSLLPMLNHLLQRRRDEQNLPPAES